MTRTQILITFLGAFFLSVLYLHPIQAFNQDLGRHILLGDIILQTRSIPDTNLLSYTYPDFPFLNHHYLSEIIYATLFHLGGINILLFLTLICILTTYILSSLYKKIHPLSLILTTFFFLGLMAERTDIRPEVFSYLFLSIFIFVLFRNREKATKLIFILPLVQVLWTNIHIYFPLGLAVTGLFLLESLIKNRKDLKNKNFVTLFIATSLVGAGLLINPQGITGTLYPFTVLNSYGYTIEENQAPFFLMSLGMQKTSFLYLFPFILVTWSGLFILRRKARIIDYLLAVLFTYLSLSAVRNIPLLAIAMFPTSLFLFNHLFSKEVFNKKHVLKITALCLLVALLFQMRSSILTNDFGIRVEENGKQAADFIRANDVKGPIFNNFDIGSYLAYRLYPNIKVFIDGRPEAYPAEFIQKTYIPMQQDPSIFKKTIRQYGFNAIVFSHTDQTPWARSFIASIMQDIQFVPILLDQDIIILVKDSNDNKELIKRFGLSKLDTPLTLPSHPTTEDLKKAANFYSLVNQSKNMNHMLLLLVSIDPNNCEYLTFLATALTQTQDPLASFYQSKLTTCR